MATIAGGLITTINDDKDVELYLNLKSPSLSLDSIPLTQSGLK